MKKEQIIEKVFNAHMAKEKMIIADESIERWTKRAVKLTSIMKTMEECVSFKMLHVEEGDEAAWDLAAKKIAEIVHTIIESKRKEMGEKIRSAKKELFTL
jgi:hypothetical protein